MKSRVLVLGVALLLAAPFALAQGKGQGGGSKRPEATSQGKGQRSGDMDRTREQDRQRIHATDQQRDQYRTCTMAADRARKQARDMSHDARGQRFNSSEARRQREQLRNELRMMEEEHARFMNGLSEEQRGEMREQIRNLEQARERLQLRLQELDQELGSASVSGNRVEERAREVERVIKEWQKAHRHIGAGLGV